MSDTSQRLNVHLAAAQPLATYRMIDRVAERKASGAPVISLNAGEPDFDTPPHVCQAAIAAITAGHTRYTQVAGLRALREAVAAMFGRENGIDTRWQQTLVCSGGKQVIYNALAATLNDGDEVIIPAPYWVSYPEMVQLCGAKATLVACGEASGFKLTPQALADAITPRTRWLILNSPSNPTGAVYSAKELRALAEVLLGHPDVLVLSDDIHEHLVFDGAPFATLAQADDERGLQGLRHDRLAHRLRDGARLVAGSHGEAAGPADLRRLLHLAACRAGRADRAAGICAGHPRRLRAPPRCRGDPLERHPWSALCEAGGRVLCVRVLRRADRPPQRRGPLARL
jgi:DNA-binding transcriptional MocR family regulator